MRKFFDRAALVGGSTMLLFGALDLNADLDTNTPPDAQIGAKEATPAEGRNAVDALSRGSTFSRPASTFSHQTGTFSRPEGTFSRPTGTFSRPEGTFSRPEGSFSRPTGTFSRPEETFSRPAGTLSPPTGTFSRPAGTFSRPEGTFSRPEGIFSRPEIVTGPEQLAEKSVNPPVVVELPPGAFVRKNSTAVR